MKISNLEYLIDFLRLHIGDTGVAVYSDETLHNALRYAVSSLASRWNTKYFIDIDGVVHRNTDTTMFDLSSPPIVQATDYRPIVLMASIIIKGGKKFSESGNAVSWRDDEVVWDGKTVASQITGTLQDDINELDSILGVGKRLARPIHGHLYGYSTEW
jgi:hypothetical protein